MPSHSVKQAKVMSAIAHGWKPKGSVAKIPVKVAKDFHAADAGHKYGAKHSRSKRALNTVRKYARKAEGGEVEDDPKQQAISIRPVDPNEGIAADLMKKTPLEGAAPAQPSMTAHHDTPRETITNMLAGPDTKSYDPRAVLANKAMNVLDFTPPMMAEQAGEDAAKGEYQNAALFAMPGVKKAKSSANFAFSLLHAAENPLSEYSASNPVGKKLKEQYGKDLAAATVEYGYSPQQIENIKTYMTPGAQANFDKHYNKLAPKTQPAPWLASDIQATKPSDHPHIGPEDIDAGHQAPLEPDHPNYIADYHAKQGADINGTLAAIEAELGYVKNPVGISANQFHVDSKVYDANEPWPHYEKLHEHYSEQPLDLTPGQKNAVAYWGDPTGYKVLNGHLRGVYSNPEGADTISHLDSAIDSSPLPEASIMWRGLHGPHAEQLRSLKEGDTFWNAGYTATTVDPRRATHYGAKGGPGVILNYHLPEGFPALYTSHPDAGGWSQAEREMLLPHGTPFKIIDTETIKAPTWDYTGGVKSAKTNDFIVYHVVPAEAAEAKGAKQLDKVTDAAFMPSGPHPWKPFNFKPKGKDTDIEEYYASMEKHQAGPEWEPEPAINSHGQYLNAPYTQHIQGKIDKSKYLQLMQSHLKPSDYMAYRPKDLTPQEQADISSKINWGTNDPAYLRSIGVNTDTHLQKGGYWSEYDQGPFTPGGYPKYLMDPNKKENEPSFHMTTKPGIAAVYHGDSKIGGSYVAVKPKFAEFDWPNFFGSPQYSDGDLDTLTKQAKKMGLDMVAVHNMHDVGSAMHGLHTQYLVLNTNILRAPHAAFDPKKWHLRYPLAGIAGTAGAGIYTYGDQSEGMKEGGKVTKKEDDPKDHEFIHFAKGGLIDSDIPGRTDKIPMKVKAGSYVLPADIPSALGQNNTKAGSEVLKKMFSSGPYGLAPPRVKSSKFHFDSFPSIGLGAKHKADGGPVDDHVPIVAAGGEYVIHPDVVKSIGHGDMTAGHKVLDRFVLHTRKEHIKALRNLKPPKQ